MDDKSVPAEKGVGFRSGSDETPVYETGTYVTYDEKTRGFWTRMGCTPDSFRRRTDRDADNMLNHTLKPRHLHMIAIGGSIGAGFFVGSGSTLNRGGPATLPVDFAIMGIMIFNVVYALGELAIIYPVFGGFYTYSTRFTDPSWGFAIGWNYVFPWAIVLPLELVVAGFTVGYWNPDINVAAWITIFLVAIVVINVFGVLGFAEEEFWRITFTKPDSTSSTSSSSVSSLTPPTNASLGANPFINVAASPFVIAARDAGLVGYDSFMNFIILISIISISNSGVYGGSRTLTALAKQGYTPKLFSYIDRAGRPHWSTIAILLCGVLAYITLSASGPVVFGWFLALSGLAALFTWGSICLAHIRFRRAWRYRGHTLDEISFKAVGGVYGSWVGLGLIVLVLMAQFYTALYPLGNEGHIGTAEDFFKAYLALPVVLLFWVCGYFWKGKAWLRTRDIDVDAGKREVNWEVIYQMSRGVAGYPAWNRL